MADKTQITVKVRGHVQGVCFRYFVKELAIKLNLQGYVRNLPDGDTVEIKAVGEQSHLENIIKSLREGPQYSTVSEIEIEWSDHVGYFNGFIIRY